jgi:hypothetical protein
MPEKNGHRFLFSSRQDLVDLSFVLAGIFVVRRIKSLFGSITSSVILVQNPEEWHQKSHISGRKIAIQVSKRPFSGALIHPGEYVQVITFYSRPIQMEQNVFCVPGISLIPKKRPASSPAVKARTDR